MLKYLRIKIVTVIMVLITVTLCLCLFLMYRSTAQDLEQEAFYAMETISHTPLRPGGKQNGFSRVNLPYFVVQLTKERDLLTLSGGYFDLSDQDYIRQIVLTALKSGESQGTLPEYNLRYLYRNDKLPTLVFADMTGEQAALASLLRSCIATGIGAFVLFLGLAILLSFWITRPIERAWNEQRQFIADASHELKTPLTVILTNTELLESQVGQQQNAIESIGIMSRQMRHLVEEMLELARADIAITPAAFSPVDLSQLCQTAVLPFEALLFEKELLLTTQIDPGIFVQGNAQRLTQVIEILLDNAGKYADTPGCIQVTLHPAPMGSCRLTVTNPGAPIPPEQLAQLFRRFYRGDPARSRDGSFGLGLSIAQSIVSAHRGRIWAESRDGLNTFCVQLPLLSHSHRKSLPQG